MEVMLTGTDALIKAITAMLLARHALKAPQQPSLQH